MGGCHDLLEYGQTQDINKQILLSEDCVVEDINPDRASETNVHFLLNFLLNVVRYYCLRSNFLLRIKNVVVPREQN